MSDEGNRDAGDEDRVLPLFDARQYELAPFSFDCVDCGVDTSAIDEWYVVRDELWVAANSSRDGVLCVGCLEERLGRRLSRSDFTSCEVNENPGWRRSSRLTNRLAT